jgi:hypothetical protein
MAHTERSDLGMGAIDVTLVGQPFNQTQETGGIHEGFKAYEVAIALADRFRQYGGIGTLKNSIHMFREALRLLPQGHPKRSSTLNRLTNALLTQYKQCGEMDVLAETICLRRTGLTLAPPGHPDRDVWLGALANALLVHYNQTGDVEELTETIHLHQEALILRHIRERQKNYVALHCPHNISSWVDKSMLCSGSFGRSIYCRTT